MDIISFNEAATANGRIDTLDSTTVKLTGSQAIDDVKTFLKSPIVPTPTTGTQAVNKAYVDNRSALSIGTILNAYTIFDNCIVAFGGEFNRADYPKLWAYIQGKSFLKSDAEWQDEATANDGICGFYSTGNGTTTFRVPNLDKAFLRPDSRTNASYQGDAIRNITGRFPKGSDLDFQSTTGPFFKDTQAPTGGGSGYTRYMVGFNASLVVPTADENRPKNIAVLPLIVAK